jgi:hypothetical protein
MDTKRRLVSGILAGAAALAIVLPSVAAERRLLRLGPAAVAEARGDRIVPLREERDLLRFLEAGLRRSDDARVHATLQSARIERDGPHTYLVGRGRNGAGSCVTASVLLEPGSEILPAAAALRFLRLEICVGTTCPSSGCLAERDEDGHIQSCTCLPAGECEKVILLIPIPL